MIEPGTTTETDKLAVTIGSIRRWLAKRRACWQQDIQQVDGGVSLEEWFRDKPGILAALEDLDETLGDDERGADQDLDVVDESAALTAANLEIERLRGELERLSKSGSDAVRILSPMKVGPDSHERVVARIDIGKQIKASMLGTSSQDWIEIDLGNGVRKRVRKATAAAPNAPEASSAKSTPKNTTLRAYMLSDRTGYREACELVFALTARAARRKRSLDGVEFIDLEATRSPKFDEFAGVPGRPNMRDKLERGWWQGCGGCGDIVRLDGDESDAAKVITEAEAFCNETCQATHEGVLRGLDFANAERAEAWPEGMTKPERMWRPARAERT